MGEYDSPQISGQVDRLQLRRLLFINLSIGGVGVPSPPLGGAVSIHTVFCRQVAKSMLSTSKIVIMEIPIEPRLVRP